MALRMLVYPFLLLPFIPHLWRRRWLLVFARLPTLMDERVFPVGVANQRFVYAQKRDQSGASSRRVTLQVLPMPVSAMTPPVLPGGAQLAPLRAYI